MPTGVFAPARGMYVIASIATDGTAAQVLGDPKNIRMLDSNVLLDDALS
jgi:hypothetical protein